DLDVDLDPRRARVDDRHAGEHVSLVDPVSELPGHECELGARVDPLDLPRSLGGVHRDRLAVADEQAERVGDVELALCVVRIESAVRAGTSPFRTATSPVAPASASRAERTASPVPSGSCCTATSTPSNESALSGDATTTTRSTPASRAARTTQSAIRRPSSGCRCFGVALFMRVPSPPAITTAARSSDMSGENGWGARIRTWDHGTKTRCLTTWP